MVGPARWTTATNWEGILDKPYSHHAMTHSIARHVEQLLKLDQFHVLAFTRLLERMDKIEEANGTSLLDNTIFTLGAGMGAGTTHQYNALPIVVAGGGATGGAAGGASSPPPPDSGGTTASTRAVRTTRGAGSGVFRRGAVDAAL